MRSRLVTGLLQFNGIKDGICIGVIGVFAGKHLFHLIFGSRSALDDRLRPILDRFIRLSPIMILRFPRSLFFKFKGCQTQSGYIQSAGLDFTGEVRMPPVTPLLPRRHNNDFTRHHLPMSRGSDSDDTLISQKTTRDSISFHCNDNQFKVTIHIDIILGCLLWQPAR